MNTRKARPLTPSKFPGMTREEYDARVRFTCDLVKPRIRVLRLPGLNPDGLPGTEMMASAVKRLGASAFGGMYRKPERPKTQAREMARRLRRMAAPSA